ncbi:hypothetical protein [Hydrogenophaga pseudoflava]|uniref:hypothetical protein n=1 Tax=Hydrogenophaga pseudoflava TaxID=47421 RepID=UPI0027E57D0B|nr:hypothetical protein [Hydrogenophaga pseudoflava]MDQ7742751.1 hypothetical protein [Hydrogenophaga pseudoflava]
MNPEEKIQNCLYYFIESVSTAAAQASLAIDLTGGDYVSWELINDLVDHGDVLLRSPISPATDQEKAKIAHFLELVRKLPTDIQESSIDTLNRTEWRECRTEAKKLLEDLSRLVGLNKTYFQA